MTRSLLVGSLLLIGPCVAAFKAPLMKPASPSILTKAHPTASVSTPLESSAKPATIVPPTYSKATWLQTTLPAVAYTALGTISLTAIHFIQPILAWKGILLVSGSIVLPMALAAGQLWSLGGEGIAKNLGGEPAPAHITRLANDAAIALGTQPPAHVYLLDKKEPNAFATGLGSKDSTVAVTKGLVDLLSENEVRAVLAHEMGHLLHKDVARNMHVAVAAIGLGGLYEGGRLILRLSDSGSSRKKKDDESGTAGVGLALMAAGLGSQAVAHLLRLGASRTSELRADAAAAAAYGSDTLISALSKIHRHGQTQSDLRSSAAGRQFAFAMISDGSPAGVASTSTSWAAGAPSTPSTPQSWWRRGLKSIGSVMRTHPGLDERVASLNELAARGEVPKRAPGGGFLFAGP